MTIKKVHLCAVAHRQLRDKKLPDIGQDKHKASQTGRKSSQKAIPESEETYLLREG